VSLILRARWLLLSLVLASTAAGFLTAPRADAAVNTINLYVNPGTTAGSPNLNCGWHDKCLSPYAVGPGLDWQQSATWTAYFRSWAVYNGPVANMSGIASDATSGSTGCYTVRVDVRRPNLTALGPAYYVHTNNYVGGVFTISAGPLGSAAYTNRGVGTTVGTEQCSAWTAAHLHQEAGSPFAKNSYYPNAPSTMSSVDVTSQTKYQNYVSFQY
jgi:hypothetical protein